MQNASQRGASQQGCTHQLFALLRPSVLDVASARESQRQLHTPGGMCAARSSSLRISTVAAMPPTASRIMATDAQDTAAQHLGTVNSAVPS